MLLPAFAWAQVQTPTTITPISLGNTAYTQDFNTLASTGTSSAVPAGFGFVETNAGTGTGANDTYTAVTVTATSAPSAGDTYSFGFGTSATTDRAFGSIRSGSLVPQFGFAFTNNTGAAVNSVTVSYTGEVYRLASTTTARADRLDFQYSTTATSLSAGTYTDADALDYTGPVNSNTTSTGYDGNDPANRTTVTGIITGLSITPGATFYIRFSDFDAAGSDDGLAIDDFSITAGASNACNAAFSYSGSPFCQNGTNPTPTVTGTTGGVFSSTTGLAITASTGTINLVASTPGTYTVTYTVSSTCSSTQSVTITALPKADFSYASTANTCTSNTGTVSPTLATGATAGTFTSTTGLTLDATTGAVTPSTSTPGTYTVTNTVPAGGGCPAVSATAPFTINALPAATLTAGGPTTFCQGGSVVLTAAPTAGATYQFFNGTTSQGPASATNTLTATAGGSYTVAVTSAAGCAATSAPVAVTVNPQSTATFAYSGSPFCQNGTNPTPTVTGTAGGTFSSTTGLTITASTGTIDLAASTPGTYSVTYSVGGSCPSSASQSVTITALPKAGFSYASASYCTSNATAVSPTLATGATAGTFTSTAGLTLDATTGAITASTSTQGTYTVTNTVPAANGCAAVSSTATVAITAAPIATFSYGTTSTYCVSGTTAPAVVLGTGATAGTFSSTTGLTINATTGAITLSSSTPGTYTVTNTIAAANGCAPVTATTSVTITAALVAAFSYGPTSTYCVSGPTNPAVVLGTGSTAGAFSSTTGLGLNATTGDITLSSSTPGTYTVTNTVAAANGCAATTATTSVTITAAPVATFSYPTAGACAGSTALVSPTLAASATAGTFSSTTGLTLNATTGEVNPATSTAGTYTVTNTVAAANGCAAATATATFTVNPRPATPTLSAAYNGTTTTLTSSAATGNQFSLNGTAIAGATGQTYVVNGAPAQLGSYTVTTTNANGCTSLPSASLVVTSIAKPLAGSTLSVYPNPTPNGLLTVELAGYHKAVELTVLNALGQTVFSNTVPAASGTTKQVVDLTQLPAGIYVLRAKTEGGLDSRRVVKQ
ncbi:hypothetical protein BEN47_14630 [Hymenobacter lapidarius]|uniref:Secretion system C-terminal sorting domain-containing protein n=1 Tax=Hymenobacter lapidarius TaxID=1908237 RepID=A0A1G1T4B8_9BACT|nr:hypothetical protein BEN47_14630 [Hymenobacter lapidarius]